MSERQPVRKLPETPHKEETKIPRRALIFGFGAIAAGTAIPLGLATWATQGIGGEVLISPKPEHDSLPALPDGTLIDKPEEIGEIEISYNPTDNGHLKLEVLTKKPGVIRLASWLPASNEIQTDTTNGKKSTYFLLIDTEVDKENLIAIGFTTDPRTEQPINARAYNITRHKNGAIEGNYVKDIELLQEKHKEA